MIFSMRGVNKHRCRIKYVQTGSIDSNLTDRQRSEHLIITHDIIVYMWS